MGVITIEKIDQLWWMGRYTERVYTTIRKFILSYDYMIDGDENFYADVCGKLGIPNTYKDAEDFLTRYPFDEEDPNSIVSNLNRALDNAMILREVIGSETLGYLYLAMYDMKKAALDGAPLVDLQFVLDHILAFWGCIEENVYNEEIRNIARAGKRRESFDLLLREGKAFPRELEAAWNRLKARLDRSPITYDADIFDTLHEIILSEPVNYRNALELLGKLLEEHV